MKNSQLKIKKSFKKQFAYETGMMMMMMIIVRFFNAENKKKKFQQ